MIPAVPRIVRYALTLALKVLAFGLEVVAILMDALAGWISPELVKGKTETVSDLKPRP